MEKRYISVFALNKYIKAKMNQDVSLQNVYIKGEISNYRPHPSGHLYFTLKDENSRVNAIMFASAAQKMDFQLDNGMQVFIHANVSVYELTGQYQLYVESMQQDGVGNLYLKFEALKKKLEREGLFLQEHKKIIPAYPRAIAVLSAKQGAALQDVVRTIHLRFPFVKVIVFPIPVQGKNAYIQIVETLNQVDQFGFDTIILARGGGSIEDLWNFNEEDLARCIYACQTPIISGIGHETDFTICDFVSDYRSATPTAAAMKATPDQKEMKVYLEQLNQQLHYKMEHLLRAHRQFLMQLQKSYFLTNPEILYVNEVYRLTKCKDQLAYQLKMFDLKSSQQLQVFQTNLKKIIDMNLQFQQQHLQKIVIHLDAVSPLKVMQRGYTLVEKDGQILKSSKELKSGDCIDIKFYDGYQKAKIK